MKAEPRKDIKPQRWVVIEIDDGKEKFRKILSSWFDEQDDGLDWRMSSKIVDETEMKHHYEFTTASGSTYLCLKTFEGLSSITSEIYHGLRNLDSTAGKLIADKNIFIKLIPYGDLT